MTKEHIRALLAVHHQSSIIAKKKMKHFSAMWFVLVTISTVDADLSSVENNTCEQFLIDL